MIICNFLLFYLWYFRHVNVQLVKQAFKAFNIDHHIKAEPARVVIKYDDPDPEPSPGSSKQTDVTDVSKKTQPKTQFESYGKTHCLDLDLYA